ncbi:MAG TPA: hypothetical protein VEA44_18865 [Caulobacter sp.]|nr:hypothetical protein [Caulobacter sp.]
MYVWTGPHAPVQQPTPLLRHLAGEFADQVNLLWPAPHTPFLTAPAARRQLICLALGRSDMSPFAYDEVLDRPLKRAVRILLPDAPDGLARALEHLGEVAWTFADYSLLLDTLADRVRSKPLRHAELIRPIDLEQLAAIPRPLVRAGMVQLRLGPDQLALLMEAHAIIARRSGEEAATAAAVAWGRFTNAQSLFKRVQEDIIAELPPHPFKGDTTLRPLTTKAAMREAGGRYRNCLGTRVSWAASGDYAYFEWKTGPGAIVELTLDAVYGWRLSEAKLTGNATLSAGLRLLLARDLEALGIHVGRGHWQIRDALRAAHKPDFKLESIEEALNNVFDD